MTDSSTVKGCCPLDCPDTCSWVAHIQDGRVERVDGAKDHPYTRGGLCAKVRTYQDRTYSPDRLLHPLKRTGPKGSGQFERISWPEALTTISERFKDSVDNDGAEALMPMFYLGSMGVVQRLALMRLFNALGASKIHGNICGASGGALLDDGHPIGFDPEEFVDSRLIILWGSNVLTTGHHQWHFMKQARQLHGARIICIDPRRTITAAQCDQHIAIRPCTDAILAAGIARIMYTENRVDHEYVNQVTDDLETYYNAIEEWTPERVAAACEIPTQVVIDLAHEFSQAQPAAICCGVGPQQDIQGDLFVHHLSALAILGGHWKIRGGGLLIETYPIMHEDAAACPELIPNKTRSLDLAKLGPNLTDEHLFPAIKGMMIWNMNPAVVLPDAGKVCRGLQRDDLFTVVLEHFMTDTARLADIVLPSTTQLEHFDLQGAWGHHYISVNNPAIAPLGESKSHGEVMRLLAQQMGLTHPELQATDEEIAASALPDNVEFEALKADGWKKNSPPRPQLDLNIEKLSLTHTALAVPTAVSSHMLQLLTPKAHYFLNSSMANLPRQRKSQGQPTLEMNPADTVTRSLVDGQQIVLSNELGEIRAALKVTDTISSGVVALPGKWWSQPAQTNAVANLLTPSSWTDAGQPAYNNTYVTVKSSNGSIKPKSPDVVPV
jgi:anaerobic selenocysteine-containing dehydrogenase